MDFIDLRPLEFAMGQAIMGKMVSNDPDLSEFQRDMLDTMVRRPQMFLREPSDYVGNEMALTVEYWMYNTLMRAPQSLFDGFTALKNTVKRFGSWNSTLLTDPPKSKMARERLEYTPSPSSDEVAAVYDEMISFLTVVPIDGGLVPKIFEELPTGKSREWGFDVGPSEAKVDLENGYFMFGPVRERIGDEIFDEAAEASTEYFDDPSLGVSSHLSSLGLRRSGEDEIAIRMDRRNPVFDPFEPYARKVLISSPALFEGERVEIDIGRDMRPVHEPLLYEFTPDAKRASSLPQDETLWRVEATVGAGVDPRLVMEQMKMMGTKPIAALDAVPEWLRDPPHIFLEGARNLFDMRKDEDRVFAEKEIIPGRSVAILGTGQHAPTVLKKQWKLLRGDVHQTGGGGASSGIGGGGITNGPMMSAAFGMNPGLTALNSGMIAARLGVFR